MPFLDESSGGKIKPANMSDGLTQEQFSEKLRCALDPIYFIENYVKVQHPTKGAIPFILFDYQKKMVQIYKDEPQVVVLLSRQCGKSQTAAAFLLWEGIFCPDQFILVLSKDHAGAKDIMSRIWYAYEELPWWIKPGVRVNQVHTKVFENNTTIKALATTKSSGRGLSISRLYCDEFAFVRPSIAEEFWTSIWPTVSTGGKCIMTSTPNTDEDKFAKIFFAATPHPTSDKWVDPSAKNSQFQEEEIEPYETLFESARTKEDYENKRFQENPEASVEETGRKFVSFHALYENIPWQFDQDMPKRTVKIKRYRDDDFRKSMFRAGFTESQFNREFLCGFVSGDETLISPMRLATLKFGVREPRFVDRWGTRWYEEIYPCTAYAVVLDPSEGVGLNDACIQVWEIPSLKQVAEWSSNDYDHPEQARMLRRIMQRIHYTQNDDPDHDGSMNIYYSVERNGVGIGIVNAIEYEDEKTFPGYFVDGSQTTINAKGSAGGFDKMHKWRGLWTSVGSKRRFCLEFKSLIERGLFIPRSSKLVSQLKTFVRTGPTFSKKEGCKDDVVMAGVLMCHLIEELRLQEPQLDDMIRPDLLDDYDEDDPDHPDNQPMLPIV